MPTNSSRRKFLRASATAAAAASGLATATPAPSPTDAAIYARLGIRPVINGVGVVTHLGLPSPLFGHSTQTLANSLGSGGANGGFNPLYQIGGPRSIQLALKLQF